VPQTSNKTTSPGDEYDQYGKLAVVALKDAIAVRRLPTGPDAIGLNTLLTALVKEHLSRIEEDGRAARTLDTRSPFRRE
jgi:hypothetical protein